MNSPPLRDGPSDVYMEYRAAYAQAVQQAADEIWWDLSTCYMPDGSMLPHIELCDCGTPYHITHFCMNK
jgi:hypothetical protein